jgi:hypothetical protein
LAPDLKLIKPDDSEKLAQQTTEIKRMLTVFVQKRRLDLLSSVRVLSVNCYQKAARSHWAGMAMPKE